MIIDVELSSNIHISVFPPSPHINWSRVVSIARVVGFQLDRRRICDGNEISKRGPGGHSHFHNTPHIYTRGEVYHERIMGGGILVQYNGGRSDDRGEGRWMDGQTDNMGETRTKQTETNREIPPIIIM